MVGGAGWPGGCRGCCLNGGGLHLSSSRYLSHQSSIFFVRTEIDRCDRLYLNRRLLPLLKPPLHSDTLLLPGKQLLDHIARPRPIPCLSDINGPESLPGRFPEQLSFSPKRHLSLQPFCHRVFHTKIAHQIPLNCVLPQRKG